MNLIGSSFLDFSLPSAATWFYLSLVLVVALFCKFNQLFSLRNWDLLTLFLLVPALLYLRDAQETKRLYLTESLAGQCAQMAGAVSGSPMTTQLEAAGLGADPSQPALQRADRTIFRAYLLLLIGSAYFFLRCLIDLGLTRRPSFVPNLSYGGLIWLGLTLFVVLAVKTMLPLQEPAPEPSKTSMVLEKATKAATEAAEEVNRRVAPEQPQQLGKAVRKGLALACHLLVVCGLVVIGVRHFQSLATGMAAGGLYLLLPYTAYSVQQLHHVFPPVLLLAALAAYRMPTLAGLLLGAATGMVYFPILLLPLWLGFYRGNGMGRFVAAFLLVPSLVGTYLLIDGSLQPAWQSAMSLPELRAWDLWARPTAEGVWTELEMQHAYRLPLFIAYLILVGVSFFWPAPKSLSHLIALSTALIIGIQFWYADHGGTYVLWYLPLLILLVCRPSLSDRTARVIDPAADWLHRVLNWTKHIWLRMTREPIRSGR